jgi:hypothetical protein
MIHTQKHKPLAALLLPAPPIRPAKAKPPSARHSVAGRQPFPPLRPPLTPQPTARTPLGPGGGAQCDPRAAPGAEEEEEGGRRRRRGGRGAREVSTAATKRSVGRTDRARWRGQLGRALIARCQVVRGHAHGEAQPPCRRAGPSRAALERLSIRIKLNDCAFFCRAGGGSPAPPGSPRTKAASPSGWARRRRRSTQ